MHMGGGPRTRPFLFSKISTNISPRVIFPNEIWPAPLGPSIRRQAEAVERRGGDEVVWTRDKLIVASRCSLWARSILGRNLIDTGDLEDFHCSPLRLKPQSQLIAHGRKDVKRRFGWIAVG